MIIRQPEIIETRNSIRVLAEVYYDRQGTNLPAELWFKVPKSNKDYISDRYEAFVVGLLPIAMHLEEDLHIEGSICPKLLRGLQEYQSVFSTWWPDIYKKINIRYKSLKSYKRQSNGVASCFSAGVDSFHTLYSCLNQTDKDYKTTHTLFIQGLEVNVSDNKNFKDASSSHHALADELNITPLELSTNLLDFGQIIPDNRYGAYFNGTFLVGCALIYAKKLAKLYIPASYQYGKLIKWSTHPMIDHLLSTESMEIIHHGASVNRTEKTEFIAKYPHTYDRLRVCGVTSMGMQNCSRCEKCLRTMITLEANGDLEKYTTFALPLTRKSIREFPVNDHSKLFLKQTLNYVKRKGRKDIAFDIKYALLRSQILYMWYRKWHYIYDISAALKKRSETYKNFVKYIKNDNSPS